MAEKEAKLTLRIKQIGSEALEKVRDGLANIAKAGAATAVVLAGAVAKGIAAFKEQELAVNRLNQAMVNNGDFTVEASNDLQKFASQLQATSTFGDETIISMLSLAKSFGVSNEEAKKMVQAAADLSAATGMQLESAVKNLGKTFAGMTGELGESVPALKELTQEQLKSGQAIDMVAEKFKGSTQATIAGLGAIEQLQNTLGDFMETIGKAFAPFISFAAQQLNTLTNETSKASGYMNGLNEVALFVSKTFVVVKNTIVGLAESIGTGLAAAVESITLATQLEFTKAKEAAALGLDEMGILYKERKQILNDELEAMDQLREQQDIDRKVREEQMLAQSNANKLKLVKTQDKALLKQKAETDKKEFEMNQQKTMAELAMAKGKVDVLSSLSNLITTVAGRDNKAAFLLAKGAAIAQSIVATNLAAAQARAVPPAPNEALAGYAMAAGRINTAAIAATAIQGLAEGGIVKARPGGIIANIGEGGQDEAVIPLDKSGLMGNTVININGPTLGDREQAREFAVEIDRQLMMLRKNNESMAFDSGLA